MKKIKYYREKCIGCGTCAIELPTIWQMSQKDGKADILDAEFKKDHYLRMFWPDETELVNRIVSLCSTRAILIV